MDKDPEGVVSNFSYKKQHFLTLRQFREFYFKISFVNVDVVELNDFWSKAKVEVKGVNLFVVFWLEGDKVVAFTTNSLDKKKTWKKKL